MQVINCIVSRLSFICIYSFGPFPTLACDAMFIYAHLAFTATVTEITVRQLIKYFYIFKWKYVAGVNDDFAATFVTALNLLLCSGKDLRYCYISISTISIPE